MSVNAKSKDTGRKKTTSAIRVKGDSHPVPYSSVGMFLKAFKESPADQVQEIKRGLQVDRLDEVSKAIGEKPDYLSRVLDIPGANISRWRKTGDKKMNKEASERVLGMEKLIGQVQSMVSDFGNPEGFDAGKWFRSWSEEPNPALNSLAPVRFLDTVTGQQHISNLLMAMVYGVYQ
jgi:putative toxin-antitoxin system antitoxin component (TIGR02293 family)